MKVRGSFPTVLTNASARWLGPALVIMTMALAGCGAQSAGTEDVEKITSTQVTETEASGTGGPLGIATTTNPASEVSARAAVNAPLDYCFAYPEGFTQQTNDGQIEIVGPSASPGLAPGLAWIDAADAHGRTALDVANEEVNAVGGLHPRSTTMLGSEEALVLDGMPGQDAIRKVYIVHGGLLYTLNFSPDRSDNAAANSQMETIFTSVTSSWVWMSSGTPCPEGS